MHLKSELDLPEALVAITPGLIALEWRATPTQTAARRVGEVMARTLRTDGPHLMLTLANGSSAPPDATTRELLSKQITELGSALGGVAFTVEGSGFGAAAVRAIVSGMYIVTRPAYPVKVFATIPEACAWLSSNWKATASKPTASEIEAAIKALRGR